jgi:hypothetical protein
MDRYHQLISSKPGESHKQMGRLRCLSDQRHLQQNVLDVGVNNMMFSLVELEMRKF